MNGKELLQNMSYIDNELIVEAGESMSQTKKSPVWVKWSAAACLCLAAAAAFGLLKDSLFQKEIVPKPDGNTGITVSADGVTIPKMDVSLSKSLGESADMLGFFIYQGRCYLQYEQVDGTLDIIGEHLGTATGLIDEWTPEDGYVDFAGSVRGDFYSVKGYDPSFMLCMKMENGTVSTYICNTGITLKYGAELYEHRLHLLENYTAVQYESRDSWYYSKGERFFLNERDEVITAFLKAACSAEFLSWTSVLDREGCTAASFMNTEIYHVYFLMENGTTVHLRLYENGYVRFQGMLSLCVKLPADAFDSLTALFSNTQASSAVPQPDKLVKQMEKCLQDSELGPYIPSFIPENVVPFFADVYYYLDAETGKETGTKQIYLEYSGNPDPSPGYQVNPELGYTIVISRREEYGKPGLRGTVLPLSELNLETISDYVTTETAKGEPYPFGNKIDVGFWYGEDIFVTLSSRGIDAETALLIFQSIAPE